MRILVQAKPGSGVNKVEELEPGHLMVRLKAKPQKGEANQELIKTIAKYYGVSAGKVKIKTGFTAPVKVIEIEEA